MQQSCYKTCKKCIGRKYADCTECKDSYQLRTFNNLTGRCYGEHMIENEEPEETEKVIYVSYMDKYFMVIISIIVLAFLIGISIFLYRWIKESRNIGSVRESNQGIQAIAHGNQFRHVELPETK